MYSIKVKLFEEFKARVMIECEAPFGIKKYKEYVDIELSNKSHTIGRLESKAYNYFDKLEKEFKSILNDRKFKVEYDKESKLYTTTIKIDPLLKEYFELNVYTSLTKEVGIVPVTVADVERTLQNYVTRLNDMLDILT